MFKTILEDILTVSISQAQGWNKLDQSFDRKSKTFLSEYMYPLMGVTTLIRFVSVLISGSGLEFAIKSACFTFVGLFASFFLSLFILSELNKKFLLNNNAKRIQMYMGYLFSILYVMDMILWIVPELFFINYAVFYVFYVAWLGMGPYLKVQDPKQQYYALGAVMLTLLIIPRFLNLILKFILPGL